VKVIAERDHMEGITSGLGQHEYGFTPGKMRGGRALRAHLSDVYAALSELAHAMEVALD